MKTVFENYLREWSSLTGEQILKVSGLGIPRRLKRNELLLSAGEVCRYKAFVVSGVLRTYSISADGNEPVLQFSPEISWTLDAESYDKQLPSQYNIAAVQPSEVLLWHKPDFDQLLAELPPLKKYAEQLISSNVYSSRQRLLKALSASPEEKYEDFVQHFPELLSKLPLRMIAGYLGISIKTLTRIRHSQWAR